MQVTKSTFKLTLDEAQISGLSTNVPINHALMAAFTLADKFDALQAEYRKVCAEASLQDLPILTGMLKSQMKTLQQLLSTVAQTASDCDLLDDLEAYCSDIQRQEAANRVAALRKQKLRESEAFDQSKELRLPTPEFAALL